MANSAKRRARQIAYRRTRNTCVYCSRRLPKKELSLDHLVPKSVGGSNAAWNLVTSCVSCNRSRGNMELDRWLQMAPLPMFRSAETLIAWADGNSPQVGCLK